MNAYELNALKRRGIEVSALGCVMLDLQPFDVSVPIPDEICYHSTHPDRAWINGRQDSAPHLTLLYGLLENANTIREDVDEVMAGWQPGEISGTSIEVFPSPFEDEPYSCIVATVVVTQELQDAHARLSMLPHINTYPTYQPHVTIAYVNKEDEERAVNALLVNLPSAQFIPTTLNYGFQPEEI